MHMYTLCIFIIYQTYVQVTKYHLYRNCSIVNYLINKYFSVCTHQVEERTCMCHSRLEIVQFA